MNVSKNELQDSTYEMLHLLSNNGCDLVLLEMMYRPERMEIVFDVMRKSKIPVWVGFSCRKSDTGEILSLTDESKVTFKEMMLLAQNYEFDVWGSVFKKDMVFGGWMCFLTDVSLSLSHFDGLDSLMAGFSASLIIVLYGYVLGYMVDACWPNKV